MDTDLMTRAQAGDQEAFADLVYAIADRFLAVSHRILSDIDLAEDASRPRSRQREDFGDQLLGTTVI